MIILHVHVQLVKVTFLFDTMIPMFQEDGKFLSLNFSLFLYSAQHVRLYVYMVKVTLLFYAMTTMFQKDENSLANFY